MFTPNIYLFLLALIYAVILQILSLVFAGKKKIISPRHPLLFIFLLAFLIRFIPVTFFPFGSGYDVSSLRWTAGRVYEGSDIYYSLRFRHHHPYFPAFALLLSWFLKISDQTKIPFLLLMKLPTILCDSAVAVIIYQITKKMSNAFVYSLSPISLIIGAYIGQFDSIPLFFLLFSYYLLSISKKIFSSSVLGLALISKPWALLFLPPILIRLESLRKRLVAIGIFLIPLILILSLYKIVIPQGNLLVMFAGIALYDSGVGWWGLSAILGGTFMLSQVFKIITICLILINYFLSKKKNIFLVAKLTILIIYIFSFGLGGNYLLWILPFALITNDRFLKPYLLLVGGYLILFGILGGLDLNFRPPFTPQILNQPYMFVIWIFFLFWGLKEIKSALRNYIFAPTPRRHVGGRSSDL